MKPLLSAVLLLIADWATSAMVAVGNESAAEAVKGTGGGRVDRFGDALPAGALLRLGTTRLRNAQGVEGVAFSPDGKLLASCGWDDSIRLWDAATSQPAGRLVTDEEDGTFAVAFSHDGAKLASVSEQGFVRMWDLATGQQLWKVLGHVEEAGNFPRQYGTRVYGVAFSPDGATLATGGSDPTINLWDAATGTKVREFDTNDQGGDARPVAFSPDGKLLASGNPNGKILVWELATGKEVWRAKKAHERDVVSLVFTPDGQELISSGTHLMRTGNRSAKSVPEIRAWSSAAGEPGRPFAISPDFGDTTLALSPDGRQLYSAHHNEIIVWDVEARLPGEIIRVDGAQLGGRTHGLAVSPDGKLLASKGHWNRRNKVWLWDCKRSKEAFAQDAAHGSSVLAVRYSPDGSQIATGGGDNTVRLWNAATGEHVRLVDQGTGWVRFVDFTPDGKRLLFGRETHEPNEFAYKGEIKVYNVADGNMIAEMPAPDRVMCGAQSTDGKWVAAALGLGGPMGKAGDPFGSGSDIAPKIIVWDAATGQQLVALDRGPAEASSLAFSLDGTELTLASLDQSVQRWKWRKSELMPHANSTPKPDPRGFYKAVCSPSGSICIFGGIARNENKSTGKLSVMDLKNHVTLWAKDFDNVWPWELAISPDGKLLVTYLKKLSRTTSGSRLAIWSMSDGKELVSFGLPDNAVRSLAFSPDSSRVISGMELGDALVWDAAQAHDD